MTDITWTWYWNTKVTCVIFLGGAVRRAGVCRGQLVTQHFRSHFRTWKLSKTSQKRFPDAPASKNIWHIKISALTRQMSGYLPYVTIIYIVINGTYPDICLIEVVILICNMFWPKITTFWRRSVTSMGNLFWAVFLSCHPLKCDLANLVSI